MTADADARGASPTVGQTSGRTTGTFELGPGYIDAYGSVFARREQKQATSADGTRIAYEVLGAGERTIVLANGLGGRLYAWLPVVDALAERYRIVTWDYRGLFESEIPADRRRLGVPYHADDLAAVLDAEGIAEAHLIGWSMGVQVGLEFALRAPARVRSLTLINGTYGQALSTAFQPFFRVPLPHTAVHALLEGMMRHPGATDAFGTLWKGQTEAAFWLRKRLLGRKRSVLLRGVRQYVRDVFGTHFETYLGLFQQIDAHSVYHLLPEVSAPTLVVSGGFDFLTPPYQSRHIARRIPGATHLPIRLGTHFVLLEHPRRVVRAITEHLDGVDGAR